MQIRIFNRYAIEIEISFDWYKLRKLTAEERAIQKLHFDGWKRVFADLAAKKPFPKNMGNTVKGIR